MLQVNQRLIMQGISWDFYEQLLEENKDSNSVHFAYDDGFLEVEVPLGKHELPNRILQDFISNICIEKDIEIKNFGSTTFRKALKEKGCEADTAFYIQKARQVRNIVEIDLQRNPPPDLVIEVDITSPSLNKLPIYAALGVAEVWLYQGKELIFYKLFGGRYEQTKTSVALPFLDIEIANFFLKKGLSEIYNEWIKEVREWIKNK